ncbi:2-dehydro-3-deoxygalactonokinase [Labrenzia sp. PHM005]|uniref:2-dehydro-3-deoxygalactonokinase n=1 Tax=Labrenzia sp. PHM005 TaxID=2590016 RepID=UPI00113FCBE2|nr:2-dehydro-3-deoxygalactonokinase [Labrenzia sp. PHM005]QDG75379.1 2-dehydro-3-deoxygalactonokinase [Labrenzia sp. PHM005]
MNSAASDPVLIGMDWGTSSLRAFLIGSDGEVLDVISTSQGIMHVEDRDFDSVFHDLIQPWTATRSLPVIASGMITSRNGWLETPYVNVPSGPDDLASALVPFETSKGVQLCFVTGMTTEHNGAPDVMRGEETQIVGASAAGLGDGVYVMPGTHNKWITVTGDRIDDYMTYMTGELFGTLKSHTILGTLMEDGPFNEVGFRLGVQAGLTSGDNLLHELFHVRTMPLFGKISEDMSADYLSGMLIGAEVKYAAREVDADQQVTIVGRGDLADRYEIALAVAGISSRRAPDNIVARGHFLIAKSAGLIS